jgi:hypothetical protein
MPHKKNETMESIIKIKGIKKEISIELNTNLLN